MIVRGQFRFLPVIQASLACHAMDLLPTGVSISARGVDMRLGVSFINKSAKLRGIREAVLTPTGGGDLDSCPPTPRRCQV